VEALNHPDAWKESVKMETISEKHHFGGQAESLRKRFVQRTDLYARQLENGGYVCIYKPLKLDHVKDHIHGRITLGTYLLDAKSNARFIVLDADDDHNFLRLGSMAKELVTLDIFPYLENSRRGGHLWLFFAHAMPGGETRMFGRGLQAYYHIDDIELFPKQDKLSTGPGSLIRMPFGVHRISGRRYGFVTAEGHPLAPTIREQMIALADPQTVPQERIQYFQSYWSTLQSDCLGPRTERSNELLSERIKAKISVFDFVGEYVQLKPTSSGAVGLCPFHIDRHPSFGVNVKRNYWYCFAGCGGGSIIDFWMKWSGTDFKTAVKELANMLLN
jgi:hypothetical protein